MSGDRRFDVTGLQVMASVLATVTGAIAASYLGIAGTIIGAAVMSVASTVGSAVYKHYLGRTARRLRESSPVVAAHRAAERMAAGTRTAPHQVRADGPGEQAEAPDRGPGAPARVPGHDPGAPASVPGHDPGAAARAPDRPAAQAAPGRVRRWLGWLRRRPRWVMAAVATVAVFAGVVGGITVFELAAGKPLDAVVWNRHGTGTTVGGLVGGQPSHSTAPTTHPTPSSRAPASPSPGSTGTRSPSPSPTQSSGSPSPTRSASPTATPSPSATPTRKRAS